MSTSWVRFPAERDSQPERQWVRYQCAEGTRVFVYLAKGSAGQTRCDRGWLLRPDLEDMMRELSQVGVRFEQYDTPGLKTDERGVFDSGRFKAVWVKDPDNNTIAITQNYLPRLPLRGPASAPRKILRSRCW